MNKKSFEIKENIPDIVNEIALSEGFNSVSYEGEYNGAKVYSVGIIDKDGIPEPLGMPTFLLLKDGKVTIVSGKEGFELMFRL